MANIYFETSSPDSAETGASDSAGEAGSLSGMSTTASGGAPGAGGAGQQSSTASGYRLAFAVRALDERRHPIQAAHIEVKACGGDAGLVDVLDEKQAAGSCDKISSATLECITDTLGVAAVTLKATGAGEGSVTICASSGNTLERRATILVKRNGGPELQIVTEAARPSRVLLCGAELGSSGAQTIVPFSVQQADATGPLEATKRLDITITGDFSSGAFLSSDEMCSSKLPSPSTLPLALNSLLTEQRYACLPCGTELTGLRALDSERQVNCSTPIDIPSVASVPARVRYLLATLPPDGTDSGGAAGTAEGFMGLQVSTCDGTPIAGREVRYTLTGEEHSEATNDEGKVLFTEPSTELTSVRVIWNTQILECEVQS